MLLDEQKAEKLYYEIARDSYGFSSSGDTYYPLVASLDRLQECVNILNHIKLEGKYNDDAVEFVIWINYADLLIQCIENVAKLFDYTIEYGNDFQKYHGIREKTDKDFFRFIRAIVLPHALCLDDNKQKKFTHGKKAFCPFTVWDKKESVRIVYYINSLQDDLHQYKIQLIDLQKFLKKIYNQIDVICIHIVEKKKKLKERRKVRIKNENSLDIKLLRRCEKICNMNFYGKNRGLYCRYMKALNCAMDDYYVNLTMERTDDIYLELVLFPNYLYGSPSSFQRCGYAINKIVGGMEYLDSYYEKYNFPEIYEEIKDAMGGLVYFRKNMSMERVCILVLMVQFFDKLQYDKKYSKLKQIIHDV